MIFYPTLFTIRCGLFLLSRYKWTYVKLVYSDNVYGKSLAHQFISLATDSGICIATQVILNDATVRDKSMLKSIVLWYLMETKTDAQVVVMLTTDSHSRAVLEAVHSLATNSSPWQQNLTWVATDHWGSKLSVVEGLEHVAKNAITLDFDANTVTPFMNYFANLTPSDEDHSKSNPWFPEYWQQHFRCHLHSRYRSAYPDPCEPWMTLKNDLDLSMSSHVPFVLDSVNSIVLGLGWLLRDYCGTGSPCLGVMTSIF